MPAVVTIDGPAGSGKSTVARRLAGVLGFAYLDTGAMYRAVAYAARQAGLQPEQTDAITGLLAALKLDIRCTPSHVHVMLDDHDVSEAIRAPEVSELTARIAQINPVRESLILLQRKIANESGRIITDGRDQGTVVFPNAMCKFLLVANITSRAERRFHELRADGVHIDLIQVQQSIAQRDARDAHRWAALLDREDVTQIDTSNLTIDGVVGLMYPVVLHRLEDREPPRLFQ